MSALNRAEAWFEDVKAVMRGATRADEKLRRKLIATAPMIALGLEREAASVVQKIFAFVAAREDAVMFGGDFFREAYFFRLEDLGKALKQCTRESRVNLLAEIRNHGLFLEEPAQLLKRLDRVRGDLSLPSPVLDETASAILHAGHQLITAQEDPRTSALKLLWAHYTRVVTPNRVYEWRDITSAVRQAAQAGSEGKLAAFDASDLLQELTDVKTGHMSRIAGAFFEPYALASPELADAIGGALSAAARKAQRHGPGWQAYRTGTLLELAELDSAAAARAQATGEIPEYLWKKFADDSAAAVRAPKAGAIGDIDFSGLFEVKKTSQGDSFVPQVQNAPLRLFADSYSQQVYARIWRPGAEGVDRIVCRVGQSSATTEEPLTIFRIATADIEVPSARGLQKLGITQETIHLWPTSDMLQDLANIFVEAAQAVLAK